MSKPWNPTYEQLVCRDLQHAWIPQYAERTMAGYSRVLRCTRCDSLKEQSLDRNGYITYASMAYPDGYVREGEGRFTREERAQLRVRNAND